MRRDEKVSEREKMHGPRVIRRHSYLEFLRQRGYFHPSKYSHLNPFELIVVLKRHHILTIMIIINNYHPFNPPFIIFLTHTVQLYLHGTASLLPSLPLLSGIMLAQSGSVALAGAPSQNLT